MTVILDNVSFRYRSRHGGNVPVFEGLSLTVPSGECLGVLGREGSGKSTLLQLLDGLVFPDAGRVVLDGVDLSAEPARWRDTRPGIGFAFQFPEHQFFAESVRDEFLFGAERRGEDPTRLAQRASALLEETGLDPEVFLPRSPFALSIGEARRVALAVVLLHGPRLVLVDEIAAGLDAGGTDVVLKMLARAAGAGSTIIAVSHDTDFLAEIASRVIVLEGGRVEQDGPVSGILAAAELLARYGYEPPETLGIASELRRRGVDLPKPLYGRGELLELGRAFRKAAQ